MSTTRCRLTSRLRSLSWVSFLWVLLFSPLTASAANLTGLNLTPPNPTLNINKTLQLIATGIFDDGTQQVMTQAKQVSASAHTCTVNANGMITCWGRNNFGQLGNGTTTDSSVPVTVSDITTAVTVSVGNAHTCALLADGTVRCWGYNVFGQLGNGTSTNSSTPVAVVGFSTAVAISVGGSLSCALLADGTIRCWGRGSGYSLLPFYGYFPVTILGLINVVAVDVGSGHACAVLADGTVKCWGDNYYGQLGSGTGSSYSLTPVDGGLYNVVAVSAGSGHTCALLSDHTLRCWGDNYQGQLGNGTGAGSSFKVTVSGISTAVTVSAGDAHTCALLVDGTLRCWGSNYAGALGDGTVTNSWTPTTVSGISSAVAVSAGSSHSCAVLADGTLRCWGSNYFGTLGNGTAPYTPITVSGLSAPKTLSGGATHTCAVSADSMIQCWGGNSSGQLGDGTTNGSLTPVAVSGLITAVAVSAGSDYTCALLTDGTARCWGLNNFGQLGDGRTINSLAPVSVSGINSAVAISAGYRHTCALLTDGTLRCWGDNSSGQLGDGTSISSSIPVSVSGINSAVAISAGYRHTCALLTDGTLRCWGYNGYGQLGNGTTASSLIPVVVSGLSTAVDVSVGTGSHTCAALADHTVRCWGYNSHGQLGDGKITVDRDSSIPVVVIGINTAASVRAGGAHTCALLAGGTARCWGDNYQGQLGNGETYYSFPRPPVSVSDLNTAVAISAGNAHTCALLVDGTVRCWGSNSFGQLGGDSAMIIKNYTTPISTLGYFSVAWTRSNPTVATVDGAGKVKALSSGATLITASVNGLSASTLVTVPSALTLDGFWPGTANPGQFVFIFGQDFVPQQTKVQFNGIPVSFVQVADPTLLFLMLPAGDTRGPITITTPSGSVTSTLSFNAPLTGVNITGLWPSIVSPGQLVFVFGSGFVTNATTATVNGVSAPILQVLDPTLLFFMAPSTPTTGFVTVTTSAGTATSASTLTIK